jgi:ribosomal protein L7/L12
MSIKNPNIAKAYAALAMEVGEAVAAQDFDGASALLKIMKDLASLREPAIIDGLDKAEREYIHGAHHVEAIKAVRARTQVTLKDAKDLVDAYRHKHNLMPKPETFGPSTY